MAWLLGANRLTGFVLLKRISCAKSFCWFGFLAKAGVGDRLASRDSMSVGTFYRLD